MPFFLNPVEVYGQDCSNCAVELIDYAGWELCSVEAFKPCDVLRPIKPDCAVCAVDPIKLVLNFFHSNHLSLIDQLN